MTKTTDGASMEHPVTVGKAIICGLSTTATPLGGLTDKMLSSSIEKMQYIYPKRVFPLLLDYCSLYSLPSFEEICSKHNVKGLVGTRISIQDKETLIGELVFVAKNQEGLKEITRLITKVNNHKHNVEKIKFTKSDISLGQWVYNTMLPEDISVISDNVMVYISPSTPELSDKLPNSVSDHIRSISKGVIPKALSISNPVTQEDVNAVYIHKVALSGSSNKKMFEKLVQENDQLPQWEKSNSIFDNQDVESIKVELLKNYTTESGRINTSKVVESTEVLHVLEKENMPDTNFGIDVIDEAKSLLEIKLSNNPYLDKDRYRAYLNKEISILKAIGGEGYYETIIAFVKFLKKREFENGVDFTCPIRIRGSASASLILHVFGVTTDLNDPVEQGLTIERFITPYRIEFPDIDIDIPNDMRHLFTEFMEGVYGKGTIAGFVNKNQTNSFGILLTKVSGFYFDKKTPPEWSRYLSIVVSRVQSELISLGFDADDKSLDTSLHNSEYLKKEMSKNPDLREIVNLGLEYSQWTTTYTTHQSGMILSPTGEFKAPQKVTASGGHAIEAKKPSKLGYVKFDILSSNHVKFIREATKLLKKQHDIDYQVPTKFDSEFFEFLANNNAFLNQMGGEWAKKTLLKIKPKNAFELLVSLAVPRPVLDSTDRIEFFARRNGGNLPNKLIYKDERILKILEPSHGFILFDEQILALAFEVAGFDGGQADTLRTVIKKNNKEAFMDLRSPFISGVIQNGGTEEMAVQLFELLEKSVGRYAYPRAHAQSYAAIAMEQAWFKKNHPDVALNAIISAFDKSIPRNPPKNNSLVKKTNFDRLLDEYKDRGIIMAPPSISMSSKDTYRICTKHNDQVMYAPLSPLFKNIKGSGAEVVLDVIGKMRLKGITTSITLKSFIDKSAPYFAKTMRQKHNVKSDKDIIDSYKEVVNQLIYFGVFDDTGFTIAAPAAETRLEAREKLLGVSQEYMTDALSDIKTCSGKLKRVSASIDADQLISDERDLFKTSFSSSPFREIKLAKKLSCEISQPAIEKMQHKSPRL